MSGIGRREVIALIGAAAAWPRTARAQQAHSGEGRRAHEFRRPRSRKGLSRLAAFEGGMRELGWLEGRNLRTEVRWAVGERPHALMRESSWAWHRT